MRKATVEPTMPMLKRAARLRRARLSWRAIQAVLEIDYGRSPSWTTLRRHVDDPLLGANGIGLRRRSDHIKNVEAGRKVAA